MDTKPALIRLDEGQKSGHGHERKDDAAPKARSDAVVVVVEQYALQPKRVGHDSLDGKSRRAFSHSRVGVTE